MNIKKLLSYFVPINIHQKNSRINNNLEITWNNGALVMDSKNTNFSYGSLQKVLRKGLATIGFEKIKRFNTILVLGVAGGSVIKTLVDEIKFTGKIIGVEIDPETIHLANTYFGLNQIKNLEVIIDDAEKFVSTTTQKFDLIVIDIFQDNIMPDFLFDEKFVSNVLKISNNNGAILFNTIVSNGTAQNRNDIYKKLLDSKEITNQRFPGIEGNNELFILYKS
ncbi:methyltransferase domain-containing protein [Flavobacterium sp.]|uniref:spermidine synthase n=1 Tax=Flavobacterium sp. TaxID=239 RepID=UPI002639822E|nr:methyltransferase domain-containing protein [Flavobacterium sp.]